MNRKILLVTIFLFLSFLFLEKTNFSQTIQKTAPIQKIKKKIESVLGESSTLSPRLYISGGKEGSLGGGMISLAATDEPAIELTSLEITGEAEITIYKGDKESLLDYLVHDSDNNQINKNIDVSKFEKVGLIKEDIASGWNKSTKVTLPIEGFGIWLLQIKLGEVTEKAFLVRSNIGSLVKEGDNEYIFWNQNIETKRALNNGEVKIYDLLNGKKELATLGIDSEGVAKTGLNPDADIAISEKDGDLAVVPINLRYLNTKYNHEPFQLKPEKSTYFVFTDRPLYSPGNTVYFKAIIRDDDDAKYSIPSGNALVKIYPGWDEKQAIFEKYYQLSSNGTVYGEFETPKDATTGFYTLKVEIPGKTTEWYSSSNRTNFRIEYFRKPEYTLDVDTPELILIAGDSSNFTVKGNYFSGQPVINQDIKYTIHSADYYEYSYLTYKSTLSDDSYLYRGWYGKSIKSGTVTLNEEGEVIVSFETSIPENTTKSQVYSIEVTMDDGSGKPVFARKNVLVYSGEFGIYKEKSSYSGVVGKNYDLPIILSAHRDTAVSNVDLKAQISRTSWVSYQEPDKKYSSYRKEVEELPELTATTNSQGKAVISFIPQKKGSYNITLKGKDSRGNTITKKFSAWVRAEGEVFYSGGKNNLLVVKADQEEYFPTDTAHLTISSEIPDRDVFLALERDYVYRYYIVKLNGFMGSIDIPLVETDMPNMYAEATSFSDCCLNSNVTKLSVSPISKKMKITITPNKERYGPSETASFNLQTTDNLGNPVSAELAFWAVDKAIFELIDGGPNDIYKSFWKERSDSTVESNSLIGIMSYSSQAEMGGGCFAAKTKILMADGRLKNIEKVKKGDWILTKKNISETKLVKAKVIGIHRAQESGLLVINGNLKLTANHMLWVNGSWQEAGNIQIGDLLVNANGQSVFVESIFWQEGDFAVYNLEVDNYHTFIAEDIWVHNQKSADREVFEDVAYWNPAVRTDANGRAQVSFQLPDNLTTWVLAAVGSTLDTKVGQTTEEIIVSKDIIIRPVMPNILRIGDEIQLAALVQNFTEEDKIFAIDLSFDSGSVVSATHSAVLLKNKETKKLVWDVNPKQEKDNAELVFRIYSSSENKVYDAVTQKIPVWKFGFWEKHAEAANGSSSFQVLLKKDSDQDKSEIILSLGSTIIGTLPTAMKYLIGYPYGCVEQTTSRFVPTVIAKKYPDLFAKSYEGRDIDEMLKDGVNRLKKLQQTSGGWGWWSHNGSDPFITAYVVEYLKKAENLGVEVDSFILDRARNYLLIKNNQQNVEKFDQVYKTYGLVMMGVDEVKGKTITNFEGMDVVTLSMAVMVNLKNGYYDANLNGLDLLVSQAKTQGDGLYWQKGDKARFGSVDTSTAFALRAILMSTSYQDEAIKAARFLMNKRKSNYWSNTFATAQIVQALVDYSFKVEQAQPNYTYQVLLDGKQLSSGSVVEAKQTIDDIKIPANQINAAGSELKVEQSGNGQLYSTLLVNQFRTDNKAKAYNQGLKVERKFVNEKGEEYHLGVGDVVNVNITLSGLGADEYYGVIEDQLPAGMVPINPVFKNEQANTLANRYSYYYSAKEITQNGMILSASKIPSGSKTYSYKARVVNAGKFLTPPATAMLMYSPEIYGWSDAEEVVIKTESTIKPEKLLEKKIEEYKKIDNLYIYLSLVGVGILLLIIIFIKRKVIIEKLKNRFGKKEKPDVEQPNSTTSVKKENIDIKQPNIDASPQEDSYNDPDKT
ncbi:alpha-2-macroglobulin family protein [Patescibacteria group bacterium]